MRLSDDEFMKLIKRDWCALVVCALLRRSATSMSAPGRCLISRCTSCKAVSHQNSQSEDRMRGSSALPDSAEQTVAQLSQKIRTFFPFHSWIHALTHIRRLKHSRAAILKLKAWSHFGYSNAWKPLPSHKAPAPVRHESTYATSCAISGLIKVTPLKAFRKLTTQ